MKKTFVIASLLVLATGCIKKVESDTGNKAASDTVGSAVKAETLFNEGAFFSFDGEWICWPGIAPHRQGAGRVSGFTKRGTHPPGSPGHLYNEPEGA